ncbi:MAG: NAD(P)H-dependent oxidoreductase [Sneathiellales bacterium]|nr:NAD(P)H-dependent oxidoreductase [Sneathiellales bacterium]
MSIGIIVGSVREASQSARIAEIVKSRLDALFPETGAEIFSLKDLDLPLWTEDKWTAGSAVNQQWNPTSERLKACTGFVFIVPEWAGMAPPHLKNFLLFCDKGELAHKPCQLIGISSGMGGAYPVAELRMSGYKNNFLMWLPDHMILRNVEQLFSDAQPTELDQSLQDRMDYTLTWLVDLASAMQSLRCKNQRLDLYKNGM